MSETSFGFDVVIIGAGVVGCAIAEKLSQKNLKVCVFEKESRIAEGVTNRNSGVIHAGIYYSPNSLKASLCVRGNQLLYEWCEAKQVPYSRCAKLIVQTNPQNADELEKIYLNAQSSGVNSLRRLSSEQILSLEPSLKAQAALFSPDTGIVDPYELSRSLLLAAEERGCLCFLKHCVRNLEKVGQSYILSFEDFTVSAPIVINSAGLYCDEIAKLLGVKKYQIYPYRGNYFRLRSPNNYRHLIYPVRKKTDAGLGVHLTLDLAGGLRLGPDVELGKSKEDFSDRPELLERFRVAAEELLGTKISPEQLSYDTCGIRPKLRAPEDKEEKDFVISQDLPGLINLVGIESPGLTSSLAIAEYVDRML